MIGPLLMKGESPEQTHQGKVNKHLTHFENLRLKPERGEKCWVKDDLLEKLRKHSVPDNE